tara:strand:+ start:49 stop:1011 length:963 start_codon:yes stop_codon:yes gene_type:complete
MAHVDLCSGLGGFGYGFETVGLSKPVLFCEIDPWCRKVLKKHWPDVPQCEDVKELADDPDRYVPRNLDWSNTILTAGFPCQPWSISGRSRNLQEAKSDPRHIWPWIVEVVEQKRPTICIFENVPHLASLGGLDEVIVDLANANYATTTFNISAIAGSAAPHKRERLWIIAKDMADTQCSKRWPRQEPKQQKGYAPRQPISNCSGNVADTDNEGSQRGVQGGQNTQRQGVDGLTGRSGATHGQSEEGEQTAQPRMGDLASRLSKGLDRFGKHDGFEVEPSDIPRVASGIKDRANRLKGLGNAIVPQIAMKIGLAIKETQWK